MKVLLALVLCAAATHATVVPVKGERKIADGTYIQRQQQIFGMYVGLKQREYFSNEFSEFDLKANSNQWSDPEVVNSFLWVYEKEYVLPQNGVFTLYDAQLRRFAWKLFDLFYFAKDFDTFYKAASWARKRIEPVTFTYAFTLAVYNRADCQQFTIPPFYEVFPDMFVPQETIRQIYDARLLGVKEADFAYNNTGYEYNYNKQYGGVLDYGAFNQHLEHKISYFREDISLNNYYLTWIKKNNFGLENKKYGKSFFKRGEGFYYTMQQLLARYNLERAANGLSFIEMLQWEKPIQVGYNPKTSHPGGQPFIPRPDNSVFYDAGNLYAQAARILQDRIIDSISYGGIWNPQNDTLIKFNEDDGIDMLGKVILGTKQEPFNSPYYDTFYYKTLKALGNVARYKNNFELNTGAITCPFTTLRDPLYYNFLARLVYIMQLYKFQLTPYTKKELGFPGVTVKDMEFDKLSTYFEMSKFSVFNALPVKDYMEYKDFKYRAKQFRLNHKPYNYKITVESDATYEGMVRLFIGPKFDAEGKTLDLTQKRLAMFELDRFPVKISAGQNVFERNSKESPIFSSDKEGFKDMFDRIFKSTKNSEPFYYYQDKVTCGFPGRFQLPKGWKNGLPFEFTVVVSPITKQYEGDDKQFFTCGTTKLYDYRPLGFPFDRPIWDDQFEVSNIYTKEFPIYHKDEVIDN